jgi:hypothetical protein
MARAARSVHDFAAMVRRAARVVAARINKAVEEAHRVAIDMLYADRMAVRRMFYADPTAKNPKFHADGRRTIARWAKQAHVFNHSYSPEMNAEMKGMQKMFDIILADLLEDPPDFVLLMKQEEERRAEEMVHT